MRRGSFHDVSLRPILRQCYQNARASARKPWKKSAFRYMVTTGQGAYNPRLYNPRLFCQGGKRIRTTPEWAQHVKTLREELGLTQADFAKRFEVSQPAVSRWENGTKEPSVENYIRMGNEARPPECCWFWKHAGFDIDRLRTLIAEELRLGKK